MKKNIYTPIAFALLAMGHAGFAQDSSRVSQLNTVVVTATKFAKKQGETGKVLTVISREQIERNIGRSVSDILNEQAGIVINGAGSNPGKNKELYFRGATSQYTTILIDGIPAADATGLTGNAIDLRFMPVDLIERIEVLRGTQSTLYGADAIAGVINIITKKGGAKPISGFGNLTWGSNRSLKGTVGLRGHQENVDYNVSFTHFETDGISEAAPHDTVTNPQFDRDGYKQNAVMLNLGIQATEHLKLQPFFVYSDYKSSYDAGPFEDSPTNTNKSDLVHTGMRGIYDLNGKGEVHANFGYQKVVRVDQSTYGTYPLDGRSYFGELYGHYNINNWFQVLAGVEYRKAELTDTVNFTVNRFSARTQYNTSPYVSFFIKNLHGFSFEAGGRYTLHSKFGNNFTYSLNPSYLISDKLKLFVNVSSGFKAPTLTALYAYYGDENLKPEKASSYEAGFQTFLLKDKLDLRVVGFKRDIKDVIAYIGNKYTNFNKQNDKGLEVELAVHPAKGLDVKVFYAYVEGQVTTRSGTKDTTYNNLVRRPNHSGGLNIAYQVLPKVFVSTNIRQTGTRNDLYFPPWPAPSQNVELKAYTIWDMYAEYRFSDNGRLFFNANNITNNKKYWEIYGYSVQGFNMQAGISFSL